MIPRSPPSSDNYRAPAPGWRLPALALLVLVGAFLRFYRLDSLPPAAWFDEVWFALRARELLTGVWPGGALPVFYPTSFGGANAGLVYLTALVQALGLDTITSARVVVAGAGVLMIPLGYACMRALIEAEEVRRPTPFSPTERWLIPLLTAAVLACTMFFVTIGRVGMEIGLAPAIALAVVWLMMPSQRSHGWRTLAAGLVGGLAQYNGLHARFVLPLMAFVALQDLILAPPGERRKLALSILGMAALAVLVALPLIVYFADHPQWLTGRAGIVSTPLVDGQPATYPEMLIDNAWLIARAYGWEGSYDPKNVVPGLPILDPVQIVGLAVGLAWALAHLRRSPLARTLLVWWIVMTLPSLLTEGAPNLGRMVGITAPTAMLVALGWGRMTSTLSAPGRASVLPVLVSVSAAYNVILLLGIWPQVANLREQFTVLPVEIATSLIDQAEAGEAAFVERAPEAEDVAAFEYLLPGTPAGRLDFRKCLPLPHERDTPTHYLILTSRDAGTLDRLSALYPGSAITHDLDLWQERAALLEVPPGVRAPAPPHRPAARFASGITLYGFDWSGDTLRPGETLFLTLYWHAAEDIPGDWTTFAHVGTGLDGTQPVGQRDGTPCDGLYPTSQWRPGEIIPDSFAITLPDTTSPGEYPIAIGWYSFPSLERLPLLDADSPLPDRRAIIGTVRVAAP